jgi:ribosome maturation factor RimP
LGRLVKVATEERKFGLAGASDVGQVSREQLTGMLESAIEQLGYELTDLELHTGANAMLRLYIDSPDGIKLEDCEKVSRQVSALLDVEDPLAYEYTLEVSSPGLNRRLIKAAHFERFAGERVKIKLKRLLDGRRNFTAELIGYVEPNVLLKEGQVDILVPLQEIDTARIVPKY